MKNHFLKKTMQNGLLAFFLLFEPMKHVVSGAPISAFAFSRVYGKLDRRFGFSRSRFLAKSPISMSSTNVRVFLVRHGAVDLNSPGMVYPKDCFYGGQNVPLSSLGKIEAQVCERSYFCLSTHLNRKFRRLPTF